jgi:hypothetical protein
VPAVVPSPTPQQASPSAIEIDPTESAEADQPPAEEPPLEVEQPEEAETEDLPEELDPAGRDFPEEESPLRTGPRVSPERPAERPDGTVSDLDSAIQDFGRAVARARAAQTERDAEEGTGQNVFVPEFSGFPPTGFGAGNLVFESRDYDWSDYARQIYVAIWRAWHNRLYQTTDEFERWSHERSEWRLEDQTQIRFVIEASGQVTGIEVEAPSDCPPLDASAVDALAEVILPPLPSDFPRDREVVHARFIARADVMAMRPGLRRLKAMGYF